MAEEYISEKRLETIEAENAIELFDKQDLAPQKRSKPKRESAFIEQLRSERAR